MIRQTVLDATDPRQLAEFYRQLFGLRYRPGDEPPVSGQPAGQDWLVLRGPGGRCGAGLPEGSAACRGNLAGRQPLRVYADPAGHPFCIFVG